MGSVFLLGAVSAAAGALVCALVLLLLAVRS